MTTKTGPNPALAHLIPKHDFKTGEKVTALRCGRADNVQYTRHNVTAVIEKIMGAGVALRGPDGALYFAGVRDIFRV